MAKAPLPLPLPSLLLLFLAIGAFERLPNVASVSTGRAAEGERTALQPSLAGKGEDGRESGSRLLRREAPSEEGAFEAAEAAAQLAAENRNYADDYSSHSAVRDDPEDTAAKPTTSTKPGDNTDSDSGNDVNSQVEWARTGAKTAPSYGERDKATEYKIGQSVEITGTKTEGGYTGELGTIAQIIDADRIAVTLTSYGTTISFYKSDVTPKDAATEGNAILPDSKDSSGGSSDAEGHDVRFTLRTWWATWRKCNASLVGGMVNRTINDTSILASSYYNDDSAYGKDNMWRARLDNDDGSWVGDSTESNPYVQWSFPALSTLAKIETRGNDKLNNWVKRYRVSFSEDFGETWDWLSTIFEANWDGSTVRENKINPPITATDVRIYPTSWYYKPAMRAELYGCMDVDRVPAANWSYCGAEGQACNCRGIVWMGSRRRDASCKGTLNSVAGTCDGGAWAKSQYAEYWYTESSDVVMCNITSFISEMDTQPKDTTNMTRSCGCINELDEQTLVRSEVCTNRRRGQYSEAYSLPGVNRRRRVCGYGAKDCVWNAWSNFTACDTNVTYKTRTRQMLSMAVNGGTCRARNATERVTCDSAVAPNWKVISACTGGDCSEVVATVYEIQNISGKFKKVLVNKTADGRPFPSSEEEKGPKDYLAFDRSQEDLPDSIASTNTEEADSIEDRTESIMSQYNANSEYYCTVDSLSWSDATTLSMKFTAHGDNSLDTIAEPTNTKLKFGTTEIKGSQVGALKTTNTALSQKLTGTLKFALTVAMKTKSPQFQYATDYSWVTLTLPGSTR
eukprot:CAMPEP_0206486736 /NCGR_PEP_ID=MMETSP0324_2-20121206/41207_1 /ASSEMBLY_ACC=CAM_ASM_000836 /TAXON_ID=2866 /ORGANISM="Crypthecodinium cohnii, Strain Seligo" /LENGTH=794 /DNA_ID=CAMNT_0053965051 /DNA_START=173 /DNA_END=2557 /DNA_ORIENTATION=-